MRGPAKPIQEGSTPFLTFLLLPVLCRSSMGVMYNDTENFPHAQRCT